MTELAFILSVSPTDREALQAFVHNKTIPNECFDLTLCDLAEALLEREVEADRRVFPESGMAIQSKRLWVSGGCSDADMAYAVDASKRAYLKSKEVAGLGTSLVAKAEDAFARAVQRFVDSRSLSIQAAYTAYLAARFQVHQSPLSAGRNSYYLLLDRWSEESWLPFIHLRMLHWCKQHKATRELLTSTLLRRKEQLDELESNWRDELESRLF